MIHSNHRGQGRGPTPARARGRFPYGLGVLASLLLCGCWTASPREVVVYTALDREFSEPLLDDFRRQTGIRVLAKYDVESTKTVGLTQAIIAESSRPRCDLFWNNEVLHTVRLAERGLLQPYDAPAAADYPAACRAPDKTWYGFAARARVLIVNTDLVPGRERPTSILALVDRRWQGRVGVAKPLFGTTATHAACLFATWGAPRAQDYFRGLQDHAQVLSGNKQVAAAVARGQLAFGLTDTDDAIIEQEQGFPVEIVYPDQQPDGMGTLFIPNTVALIRGAPHEAAARQLLDYLLSPEVESRLAEGPSAQVPLNPRVSVRPRVETPHTVRPMTVDFAAAAASWDEAAAFLRDQFARAD